jgi:hypothetical protein
MSAYTWTATLRMDSVRFGGLPTMSLVYHALFHKMANYVRQFQKKSLFDVCERSSTQAVTLSGI